MARQKFLKIQKAPIIRGKSNNSDLIKIKNICDCVKDTIKRVKRPPTDCKKIFPPISNNDSFKNKTDQYGKANSPVK